MKKPYSTVVRTVFPAFGSVMKDENLMKALDFDKALVKPNFCFFLFHLLNLRTSQNSDLLIPDGIFQLRRPSESKKNGGCYHQWRLLFEQS